jgi:hypothetical protein
MGLLVLQGLKGQQAHKDLKERQGLQDPLVLLVLQAHRDHQVPLVPLAQMVQIVQ